MPRRPAAPTIDWTAVRDTTAILLWRAFKSAAQAFVATTSVNALASGGLDAWAIAGTAALTAGLSVLWNALASINPEPL